MRPLLAFILSSAASLVEAQAEPQLIVCGSASGQTVEIDLWGPSDFAVPLHCVDAPGLYDMTPCAPDQGWGLSYGTGMASLADVTTQSNTATAHKDGKFYAGVSPGQISAAASFGAGLPDTAALSDGTFWRMVINRTDGTGTMETAEGFVSLTCKAVARSF